VLPNLTGQEPAGEPPPFGCLHVPPSGATTGATTELKGTIVCTKCELKETAECGNAIKTKIDGKEVTVYFDDKGKGEKYHKTICADTKAGSVTGVVSEKDKKKFITPAKDGVKFE
jgi:hypothetical protein